MNFYNIESDIKLKNNDFDFIETENGLDLNLISDEEYLKQQIELRLKGVTKDWHYDNIGADLEELLGEPNTINTAKEGVEKIRNALTRDLLINNDDLYIKPAPVGENQINYEIYVRTNTKVLSFIIALELTSQVNLMEVR